VVGVFYAVLLAFAVILVWQRMNDAKSVVLREAGAAQTMYRLAAGLGGGEGVALQHEITAYLRTAMASGWPAMQRGNESPDVTQAVNRLYATILAVHPADPGRGALFAEILHQLDRLSQARQARLALAGSGVPAILWIALFVGAVVTIGFTFFFGTVSLPTQVLMTVLLALLIASQLWVIVAIDRPYAGPIGIRPQALAAVMHEHSSTLPTP
jgi:uncharacterized protein (DUF983 family)